MGIYLIRSSVCFLSECIYLYIVHKKYLAEKDMKKTSSPNLRLNDRAPAVRIFVEFDR